ncbi:MAG TPA: cytochrome C oxidase subunit IV family protein [Planctomycetota bacterium]|nr:cytochrome C oxidase subunit IV family protein [Planctomycetota bacterium]
MPQHILPVSTYLLIFAALLALLLATVGAQYIELGPYNILLALTIAIFKAVLVVLYFMHVRFSSRLTWIFASAAFLWLGILLTFVMADYLMR